MRVGVRKLKDRLEWTVAKTGRSARRWSWMHGPDRLGARVGDTPILLRSAGQARSKKRVGRAPRPWGRRHRYGHCNRA